jgi:hypothetical protein
MTARRPKIATWICGVSALSSRTNSTTSLAAGVAGQAVQNGGRSRHGTAVDRLQDVVALSGRHGTAPVARIQQLAALIGVVGCGLTLSAFASAGIRAKLRCSRGEHLARRGCSPPVFPLMFPSDLDS